jgi:hypothetical protein
VGHSLIPTRRKRLILNLAVFTGRTPLPLVFAGNLGSKKQNLYSLRIRYVTASAQRNLKGGVLETHVKRNIHHRAVKSAVRSLKVKVAYCMSLIGE